MSEIHTPKTKPRKREFAYMAVFAVLLVIWL